MYEAKKGKKKYNQRHYEQLGEVIVTVERGTVGALKLRDSFWEQGYAVYKLYAWVHLGGAWPFSQLVLRSRVVIKRGLPRVANNCM